ncbi:endonuclease/exonuclease/phosphatase family protein [Parapedobacter deserti]|uniref:Endonuclease/exonuclease/phosphatase family protein n=1 Tax=Parapedobacter deserti TaxID=1912957 RepID=A0ABV7JNQ1_9SPHI
MGTKVIRLVLLLGITGFQFVNACPALGSENGLVFHESFDERRADFKRASVDHATKVSLQNVYQSLYTEGIKGKALNLTNDAPIRSPFVMEKEQGLTFSAAQSFSLIIWIRTKRSAHQGLPIWTNKQAGTSDSVGWCLGTQDNGAWYWNMSDGNTTYSYEPTAERQAINDGEWHQLAISVDRESQEVWMYKDGRNVAIYRLEQGNLGNMQSAFRTIIGGSDSYYDFGSRGEWTAFNGLVDEASMYDRPLTVAEVRTNYEEILGRQVEPELPKPDRLKVLVWNIWHGGHRFGQHVGVERICEVLKQADADIMGLIETYGSGAIIADSLGYYFYLISDNLSIISRYPIEETIAVYKPFYSGGAILNLGGSKRLAFFNVWLWYQPSLPPISKWNDTEVVDEFHAAEERRVNELKSIVTEIDSYVKNADSISVIVAGDFNSTSHLDHTAETATLYGGVILERPVSKLMTNAGFTDSYRICHPSVTMRPGFTWSPMYNDNGLLKGEVRPTRIDYIYAKGAKLQPYYSHVLDFHPLFWPSDHASVVTSFYLD